MSVGYESSPRGKAQGGLLARRASPPPPPPRIWKRKNQSSEVTDRSDGSGLEARSPVTEHLCPPKHSWGGGARTSTTDHPGKLCGPPSSQIYSPENHFPSGHTGVIRDPGPSLPEDSPSTVLGEGNSD